MSDLKYSYTSTTQQQAPGSYLTGASNPTIQPYTSTTDYGVASSPAYTSNFQHYGISNASPLVSYNYTQEVNANVETPVRSAGSYTSGVGATGLSTSQHGLNASGLGLGYLYGSQYGTPAQNHGVSHVTGTLSSSQIGGTGTSYHHVTGGLSGSQVGAGSYLAGTSSNYTPGVTGLSASQTLANTQPGNYTTTTTTTYNVGGTSTGGNYGTTYSSGIHTGNTEPLKKSGLDSDSAVNVFLGDLRTSVIREVKKNMEYRGPTFGKELRSYIETNVQSKPQENRKAAVADALVHYNLVSSDRINNPSRLWQDTSSITSSLPGSYTATQPNYTVRDPSAYSSTHNLGTTVNVESYQTPQRTSYGYETSTIGEQQKRSTQSVPSHLYSPSRASYLDPYRQSSYPEFAIVEDLPNRTHLVDSINIFLQRSPAKEKLLVSPSRVSIKRESVLHPAEIEVTSLFKEKYEDGSVYEGDSKNGRKHGRGKIIYRDGRVFEGEFENGVAQGTGKITYSSGKLCYEGGISGTSFEGQGVLQTEIPATFYGDFNYKDFRNLGKQWLRYEGEFKGGNKHGTGTLYLSNGEKYTGEFRDDEVHGKGIFTLRDGRGVKGEWRHGVLQTY